MLTDAAQEAVLSPSSSGIAAVTTGTLGVIGLNVPIPLFVVGMFFCIFGGFVGMAVNPPKSRTSIVATAAIAFFMGCMVAYIQPQIGGLSLFGVVTLPEGAADPAMLPFVMGATGLISRAAAKRISNLDLTLPKIGRGENQ